MKKAEDLFSQAQKETITAAVRAAELRTSGEIRVYIEDKFKGEILDRAAFIFKELDMHRTEERNGVLFYLAMCDRQFAVIGDAGINKVTGPDFWDEVKAEMMQHFKAGDLTKGLAQGIHKAGEALSTYFPCKADDKNELPDEITFGKESTE